MNRTRVAIVVLSSGWFFLASCTAGLIVGTRVVAMADARDTSAGDAVHSKFSIVAPTERGDAPFIVLSLADVSGDEPVVSTFLMPSSFGKLETRDSLYSYEVLEETATGQIIEVVEEYRDGDNTIWSRYEATQTSVLPISSRMFYFGYAFVAVPYALGFAFLLYVIGRVLAFRNRDPAERKNKPGRYGLVIFLAIYGVSVTLLYILSTPTVTEDFTGATARSFNVASINTEHGGDERPYGVLRLERLNSGELDLERVTFLLPQPSITINVGDIHRAEVLEDHGDWQLVQFNYSNTYTSTSVYRAYDDRVEPVSYRLTSSAMHLMASVVMIFVALILTGIITSIIRWRASNARPSEGESN